jgi:hypothetical protein
MRFHQRDGTAASNLDCSPPRRRRLGGFSAINPAWRTAPEENNHSVSVYPRNCVTVAARRREHNVRSEGASDATCRSGA